MKLYHGTAGKIVRKILREGVRPRGETGQTNWKNTVESNPNAVYLTDTYAGYFASVAAKGGSLGIVEIETELLDDSNFLPDEDFLEQASHGQKWGNPVIDRALRGKDMAERTRWFRYFARVFQENWKLSLEAMGTCCYSGTIPPEAVTRATIFDWKKNPAIVHAAADAIVTTLGFKFVGERHKTITRWLSGYEVSVEQYIAGPPDLYPPEFLEQAKQILENRTGLTFVRPKRPHRRQRKTVPTAASRRLANS